MAEPIKISTGKYTKEGKVDIDGNVWSVSLPGAGTEMRFSQASRACKSSEARLALLDKKIEDGSITEPELDRYDEYSQKYAENEKIIYDIFLEVFRDGTQDNSQVKEWMNKTPTTIIMMSFEDIKQQATGKDENGPKEPPASS